MPLPRAGMSGPTEGQVDYPSHDLQGFWDTSKRWLMVEFLNHQQ